MDIAEYKEVVLKISTPLIIGKPIYDENGKLQDVASVLTNDAFDKYMKKVIPVGTLLSKAQQHLSKDLDWFSAIQTSFDTHKPQEYVFYSNLLTKWLNLRVNVTSSNLVITSFTDVTEFKEYEQQLKRQNLRLAALTDEISLSRESLKQKLENIESLNQKLEYNAYHDSMTGIPNRNKLEQDLDELLKLSKLDNSKFGVLLLDIDNLKMTNDCQGHAAGDDVIMRCTDILKTFEPKGFPCYRFDGDEFVVLLKNASSKDNLINIADVILESFNMNGIEFSAGISVYPEDGQDRDELLRYADMAMSDVKKKGKNDIILFENIMREKFMTRMNLQIHLTEALEKKFFVMYFQPQFNVASGELRGFEALLRWHDNELGWVNPDQFIPIAEETKMIVPLGEWILETAISTLAKWQKDYNFNGIMSVNVSPIQMKSPNFLYVLTSLINKYAINTSNLEIEVTEGVLIENKDETIKLLKKIRDMGIGVSLDDFGTGYSSLSYLQILPITTLKIDKSFIANITSQEGVEANITDSIVSMVTKMGLDTIAEGVEHNEQLELLRKIKCQNVQGFLRGKPMPQERCEAVLAGDMDAMLTVENDRN